MDSRPVRVRFAPSPTGYLHIGGARTALFNWLIARRAPGGKFILRIEDTDRSRHVEDSVQKILDDLRWLGLDWDEGPEVEDKYGPYYQSQRLELYQNHVQQLLDEGLAYHALETPEELAAMRQQARGKDGGFKYPRPDPLPTAEQVQAARDAGRPVVVRFKMPDRDLTVTDQILGEVTVTADELEDFVIQKGDGWPTYHLACVVDDGLMRISHVLRGQEHLMNTPKHLALQEALSFPTPRYAHLPVIFNMTGGKMSKRDKEKAVARGEAPPEIDVHDFRAAGYLPEALVNFISLLGWSTGDDTEQLTIDDTIRRFDVTAIGKSNARFDRDKLLAFNTAWSARVSEDRRLEAFKDYLAVNDSVMSGLDDDVLRRVLDLCKGFRTFRDVERKAGFAFADDAQIDYQPQAVKKVLKKNEGAGFDMLATLLPILEAADPWTVAELEQVLQQVCEKQGVKLGAVAQPLRVALSGTTVSPAIGDTLVLVGKERTLRRIRNALALRKKE